MPNRNKNALARLSRALSGYLKTASVDKGNKQKPPVPQSKHRPARRHQEYMEHQSQKSLNCVRSQVVNPDGSSITVEVVSHNSAYARRSYRNTQRR